MNKILCENKVLHAGLIHVIQRGTAHIYEDNETGIFLIDEVSRAAMLICRNTQTGIGWIEKYRDCGFVSVNTFDPDIFAWCKENFPHTCEMICYQAVYEHSQPAVFKNILTIRLAEEDDYSTIRSLYANLSDDELLEVIKHRQLYMAYKDGELVGFGGMHLEGAIGLIEILPAYRRRGYATELESFLINTILEKGLIPFSQIETDNTKSIALHRRLNMTVSSEKTYWLF